MIMKGGSSLACICEDEPDNTFYNPVRCNPATYRSTIDINADPLVEDVREYQVHIPENYVFNGRVCNPLRFDDSYRPAFVSQPNYDLVRQGTRLVVTEGTAKAANLPYVEVAGKTGTAQYCDNIARGLGLCRFGAWPAHAWFMAYAPFENPEIIIIGFVYNGIEGSQWALPVVVETMEAYFRLKNERAGLPPPPSVEIGVPPVPATTTPVPGG
jgi:membrane carboxypeptidase/penicillin-binding protein